MFGSSGSQCGGSRPWNRLRSRRPRANDEEPTDAGLGRWRSNAAPTMWSRESKPRASSTFRAPGQGSRQAPALALSGAADADVTGSMRIRDPRGLASRHPCCPCRLRLNPRDAANYNRVRRQLDSSQRQNSASGSSGGSLNSVISNSARTTQSSSSKPRRYPKLGVPLKPRAPRSFPLVWLLLAWLDGPWHFAISWWWGGDGPSFGRALDLTSEPRQLRSAPASAPAQPTRPPCRAGSPSMSTPSTSMGHALIDASTPP